MTSSIERALLSFSSASELLRVALGVLPEDEPPKNGGGVKSVLCLNSPFCLGVGDGGTSCRSIEGGTEPLRC